MEIEAFMFSIICVYSNEVILNKWLLNSLYQQASKYQLILIDNRSGKYDSAAKALNQGGAKAKGHYVMFVHQDVYLIGRNWLNKAEQFLDDLSNLGAAGVAGMCEEGKTNRDRGRNLIFHGPSKEVWSWGNNITEPTEVQTLDEQLLIVPSEVFARLKFDEETCIGWHLYGADYCLTIKRLGLKVFVIPLPIWHLSMGMRLDTSYFLTLRKMLSKHKNVYDRIYTTTGEWPTRGVENHLRVVLSELHHRVLNKNPLKITVKRLVKRLLIHSYSKS